MKKAILLFILSLIILFSSCSAPTEGVPATDYKESGSNNNWNSLGRAFKQSVFETPEDVISLAAYKSDVYFITSGIDKNGGIGLEIVYDTDVIYDTESAAVNCVDASGDGIWLLESSWDIQQRTSMFKLISSTGDTVRTVSLSAYDELIKSVRNFTYNLGCFYLNSGSEIFVLNDSGEIIGNFKLPDCNRTSMIKSADGNMYAVCYGEADIEIYQVDDIGITKTVKLSSPNAKVFGGDDKFCFYISTEIGVFGLQPDGEETPVLIWEDCNINVTELKKLIALQTGEFICFDMGGVSKLTPVEPSEIKNKTQLVLATVGEAGIIKISVAGFNRANDKFSIVIKDYSDAGATDNDTAIKRLNADIISGKNPDLICFSGVSPFPYIKQNYLLDINSLIDKDSTMKREDIVILKQLETNGSVYYLSNAFNVMTQVALYSEFGNNFGWTLNDYLEIEKTRSIDEGTIYNTTKKRFMRWLSERYLATAVNWEKAECDFDNDEFISILEVCNRIKENPEPENPNDIDFTYPSVRIANGTLVAVTTWIDNVGKLAFEETMAKCRLSCIGLPTVDGSCGSDIYISIPVGICSYTQYPEAAWDFLKFMLKDFDVESAGKLPAYMPYLLKQIEDAKHTAPPGGERITAEDADRLLMLISQINNVALYDENILGIIEEEATGYFAGQKTAEETAKLIQSRARIYVSEQFQ